MALCFEFFPILSEGGVGREKGTFGGQGTPDKSDRIRRSPVQGKKAGLGEISHFSACEAVVKACQEIAQPAVSRKKIWKWSRLRRGFMTPGTWKALRVMKRKALRSAPPFCAATLTPRKRSPDCRVHPCHQIAPEPQEPPGAGPVRRGYRAPCQQALLRGD